MESIFVCITLWTVVGKKSMHCVIVRAFGGSVHLDFGEDTCGAPSIASRQLLQGESDTSQSFLYAIIDMLHLLSHKLVVLFFPTFRRFPRAHFHAQSAGVDYKRESTLSPRVSLCSLCHQYRRFDVWARN